MAYLIIISLFLWIPNALPTCVVDQDSSTNEWVFFQGVRYQISPCPMTWPEADEFCRKIGGELLQVQTKTLRPNTRGFLEKTYNEAGKKNQSWWVGQYLSGTFEEPPKPVSDGSQQKSSSDMENLRSGHGMMCPCIIMDPVIHLVSTSLCMSKRTAICKHGSENSSVTVTSQSGKPPPEPSHKISKRHYEEDVNFIKVMEALFQVWDNADAILEMVVDILDKVELAKIHLRFEHQVKLFEVLKHTTSLIRPKGMNSTLKYELIFKCGAAITLISRSQCEGENVGHVETWKIQKISDVNFELYKDLGMQRLEAGEGPIAIHHPMGTIHLDSPEPKDLDYYIIGDPVNGTYCQLPSYTVLERFVKNLPQVNVQMYSYKLNPLSGYSNETITGEVCSLSLIGDGGQEVKVQNLSEAVKIFMPRQDALTVNFTNLKINKNTVVTTSNNVTDPSATLIFKMEPSENVTIQLLLAYDRMPNSSDFDHSTVLDNTTGYRWLITPEMLSLGMGNWSAKIFLINYTYGDESMELGFWSFVTKCMFWDSDNKTWSTGGCWVGIESEPHLTQCLCNHMTFYGSSFFVTPNQVDLSQTAQLFAKVSENYVVVVMLSVFFGLYLILLVWAIYADKQAFKKKKMTLLADNHPCAQYFYLLNVHTGHRRGAGTSAEVELTLVGTEGQSTRHHLTDPDKPVFERGGVDIFLLATPFPLGDLESIRVRHDNTGRSPDWYLKKVMVLDMQLRKPWHFLCSTWLSSSKGDGMTKHTFPSAKTAEITSFSNLFQTRTSSGFRDEHIWVSVVDPPRRSPFTRAQRVSCCMCLLLCTMAINIMFWNKPQDKKSPVIFTIGTLDVTWEDIMIGVESGLLMFPINILIITIFRSIKPRPLQAETDSTTQKWQHVPTRETFLKDTEDLVTILSRNNKNNVPPLEKNVETFNDLYPALTSVQELLQNMQGLGQDNEDEHWCHCSHFVLCYVSHLQSVLEQIGSGAFSCQEDFQWVQNTLALLQKRAEAIFTTLAPRGLSTAPKDKKKSGFWLPWWFVFVGWFLLLSISGISTFFTLLYGFVYGKESSTQWAISLALSLFQSIFVLQPLKVVGVAIFFALVLKTVTVEETEEVEFLLKEQQEKCKLYSKRSTP